MVNGNDKSRFVVHCHKVSNALCTLVTREQPSFQAPFEGRSLAVHEDHRAKSSTSRLSDPTHRMLGG